MQRSARAKVVVVSAVLGFCGTLAVGWPAETYADDPSEVVAEQDEFPDGFTKLGALKASSRLVQDEQVKSKWYVEIKVKNQSKEGPERGEIEARIEKTVYEPGSRGMPMGSVVWRDTETVVVPAGEAITLRRSIPAAVAWGVYRAQQPIPKNAPPAVYMRPRASYRTYILDKDAEQPELDAL